MAKRSHDKPMIVASLPGETAKAARAVFNIENVYLAIGDQLEGLLENLPLRDLDADNEFDAHTLTRLALLTVFQFAEDLADRVVCAALPQRMDWKYALHLPIQSPRLDPGWLCRFRQPLIGHTAALQTFKSLLDRCARVGLLSRDKRDIPAGAVLEHICRLNQIDRLHEDVSQAIEVLASHHPDMLLALAQPHWYDRYRHGRELRPRSAAEQKAYAQLLGADACHVLQTVAGASDSSIKDLPEVRRLSALWKEQFELQGTTLIWRDPSCERCPWLVEETPRGCRSPQR